LIIAQFPTIDRAIAGEWITCIFMLTEPYKQPTINQDLTAITNIAKTVTSIPNDEVLGELANLSGSLQDTFAPDATPLTLFLMKQNSADRIVLLASPVKLGRDRKLPLFQEGFSTSKRNGRPELTALPSRATR
jgi:hypothetical protein